MLENQGQHGHLWLVFLSSLWVGDDTGSFNLAVGGWLKACFFLACCCCIKRGLCVFVVNSMEELECNSGKKQKTQLHAYCFPKKQPGCGSSRAG